MPTSTDYDRIPYPAFAHPQTFSDNLATKGWLRGIDVTPPDRCRVLELGCGDGFNLAAMAQRYPDAHYVGLDYAGDAIARGRTLLAELGLSRIRLETADIRQPPPDLGEFDYIIAHGVYSWVPAEVAEAVLQIMDRHLAPNGVGFISYLALPGAQLREMVRLMLHFHTRAEEDPVRRVQQARGLMALLSTANNEASDYARLLKTEAAQIAAHSDGAFFHDELSAFSRPWLFTEFLRQADAHHLAFLSEAEYMIPVSSILTEEARRTLKPLESDRILLEQYLDFVEGRRFRQTLLCRTGLGASLAVDRVNRFHVHFSRPVTLSGALGLHEPGDLILKAEPDTTLQIKTPLEKALILALQACTDTVPFSELCRLTLARLHEAGMASPPEAENHMALLVIRAAVPTLIALSWGPPPAASLPPTRPRAGLLARWQVAHGNPAVVTLTGRLVPFELLLGRFLVSRLDGTRDIAALLADVRAYLASLHAEAKATGRVFSGPPADAPDLESQLQHSLLGLARLGLIMRETE